jgi:hypothetical protein
LTDGGLGNSGRTMTLQQLEKHTERVRNQAKDLEWREKISKSLMGKKHPMFGKAARNRGTPILAHVQAAMMAKHVSINPEAMEKMIAKKTGVKLSEEHRAKISVASKGKPKSDAMRAKLAQSKTGYRYTPEAREKMRQSRLAFIAKQKEKQNAID